MKIAFTHNLRTHNTVEEAEFDTPETVNAIANALAAGGHDVERVEVSASPADLAARLDAARPDLVFNTAEGHRGRWREAFFPSLLEELGLPYTGSGPHALMVTLDKDLTKRVLRDEGVDVPRGIVLTREELSERREVGGFAFPVIVKPNFEGSSKGITEDAVATSSRELRAALERCVSDFPDGALIEEYIPGFDITVPFLAAIEPDGILTPVEYVVDPSYRRNYNLYDYSLKNEHAELVSVRCPPEIPRDVVARVRSITRVVVRALRLKDVGRIDFRVGTDGRIYFLEANALPSLEPGASIFAAAALSGLDYNGTINAIVEGAAKRYGLELPQKVAKKPPLRVGFAFNMKRQRPTSETDDMEAEFDPPETIQAVHAALESLGHTVVPLEATPDLPRRLVDERVDVVFNIAEGLGTGRGREAQAPALCELVGIPCTGSDAAALAIALDKALTKRILRQHEIPTPEFQILHTGKEKLNPRLRYPVIVKPNAEGSSKGIGDKNVCDNETEARKAALDVIQRYRQPALLEDYISGREFTVGILGDRRPRVLPPMEIVFTDPADLRPIYDFAIKQEWDKHVEYQCPAEVTPAQRKQMERLAMETFSALGCRDVARVDMRMTQEGGLYVLEINPLPGLTPDFSDLVIIAKAAGIDYRSLVADILAGAIRRLRERRRAAAAASTTEARNNDRPVARAQ
jgi:D-alanine-D-alanine ligase